MKIMNLSGSFSVHTRQKQQMPNDDDAEAINEIK